MIWPSVYDVLSAKVYEQRPSVHLHSAQDRTSLAEGLPIRPDLNGKGIQAYKRRKSCMPSLRLSSIQFHQLQHARTGGMIAYECSYRDPKIHRLQTQLHQYMLSPDESVRRGL